MTIETVEAGSTSYHDIAAINSAGAAVVPESIRYRLLAGPDLEVIEWSDLTPTLTQIVVPAESNMIVGGRRSRFLTVEITHDNGNKIVQEIRYNLEPIKGLALASS